MLRIEAEPVYPLFKREITGTRSDGSKTVRLVPIASPDVPLKEGEVILERANLGSITVLRNYEPPIIKPPPPPEPEPMKTVEVTGDPFAVLRTPKPVIISDGVKERFETAEAIYEPPPKKKMSATLPEPKNTDVGFLSNIASGFAKTIIPKILVGGDKDDKAAVTNFVESGGADTVFNEFGDFFEKNAKAAGAIATIAGLPIIGGLNKDSGGPPMNLTPTGGRSFSTISGGNNTVVIVIAMVAAFILFGKKLLK